MSESDQELEQLVEDRLLRVNALSFGVVTGLLGGLGLFLATNWLVIRGGAHPGPHLGLLGQYFVGYSVTFPGSLVGFVYGFLVCFGAAWTGAWLYTRVSDLRHGRRRAGG
jgi:hypothetical protein